MTPNKVINILLVETEPKSVKTFEEFLGGFNSNWFNLINVNTLKNALDIINSKTFDTVVLNLFLPDSKGIGTFKKVQNKLPDTPIVILLDPNNDSIAMQCLRLGAKDYIIKTQLQNDLLVRTMYCALKNNLVYKDKKECVNELICKSKKMQEVFRLIKHFAETDNPILILGERGTGKDRVAEMIHILSKRRTEPFVNINCASIPRNFLKCSIAPHCKNTPISNDSFNCSIDFDRSCGGTIFLNEIGDIGMAMQSRILQIIREKSIKKMKCNNSKHIDVRIISATNRNLEQLVKEGKFKKELYCKLKTLVLKLPPLRDRTEDIPILVNHFIGIYSKRFNRPINNIEHSVLETLIKYRWPGNVRELRYVVKYACATTGGKTMTMDNLPFEITRTTHFSTTLPSMVVNKERNRILHALEKTNWQRTKAAKVMRISRTTLWQRMKLYNIHREISY